LRFRLLLLAAIVVAFGAASSAPFVFDDFGALNDPAIASRSAWWQCWVPAQTRPLTWFSFWINYQLGGENPIPYHLVNLALHIAVVLALWDVLRRLIAEPAASIATAIFALHPLVTEPVVYVFARGTLLATLFSLYAIRSWIRNDPMEAAQLGLPDARLRCAANLWETAIWFTIAMLAKEECAAIPVFLLLLDVSRGARLRFRSLAGLFAIALVFGLRVIWAAAVIPGSQAGAQAPLSPWRYLAAEGPVILKYFQMLTVPWGFSIDYSSTPSTFSYSIVAWIVLVAALLTAVRWFKKLSPGFWFIAGLALLAPSSSIFPAADLANDRRMYLPLIAFSACLGLVLQRIDWRVLTVGACALMAITIHFALLWRSPADLWEEAIRHAPDKLRPRIQLARVVPADRGLEILRQARQIAPDDPQLYVEQGRILLEVTRPAEALAAFGRALALDPGDARAINDRGAALAALGQTTAARADFERALAHDPCLFDARLNLARIGSPKPGTAGCRFTDRQREMLAQ
jgi:tetratricopeptide (TPR) repeat protein